MKQSMRSLDSRIAANWRRQLLVAFVLTALIPLLTLIYFLASYVWPYAVTVESIILVVAFNILLAASGFALLVKELEKRTVELRQKVTELASFINSIPDMAWLTDAESRFIVVNRAFGAAVGKAPGRLLSHFYETCFETETARRFREADVKAMETRQELTVQETIKRADGKALYLEIIRAPILDAAGQAVGTVGIARDMTEHRETEQKLLQANIRLSEALEELKRVQQKMIAQERLNALGQMASGIAHDFNNLLVPIVGFSELLLEQPDIVADKEDFLATIKAVHTAGVDAKRIVQRLRQFYRSAVEGEYAYLDIAQVAASAISLTQSKWQEEMRAQGTHIDIRTELQGAPLIHGSETEMREALINLILNAIDAMPQGGIITVSVRQEGTSVMMEVKDTGQGMSQNALRHSFEPFFTTKGAHGTGLGLSTVHGIVERHKGSVEIESEEGKGTTVRIRLPMADPAAGPGEDIKAAATTSPRLHILVIDDAPESRQFVSRILKGDNHTVEIAEGGREGLGIFEKGVFDLVITDRAMRDMSGDEVASSIKKLDPSMPVILLTGFADIMKEKGEAPPSVDLILGKPVTRDELREAICRVTGKAEWGTRKSERGRGK